MDDSLKIIKLMELEAGDCFEFTTWRQTGQEIWGKPIAEAEGAGEYFMVIDRVHIPKTEDIMSSDTLGLQHKVVTGFDLQIQIQDVGGQFYLEPADRDVILVEQTEFLEKEQQDGRRRKRGWRYQTVNDPRTQAEAERIKTIRENMRRGIEDGLKSAGRSFQAAAKVVKDATLSIGEFGDRMKAIQGIIPDHPHTFESLAKAKAEAEDNLSKTLPNTAQDPK